ncbi:MAG: hypothetical protein GY822_00190 [Deltaproteobacteria bacterium]|nr:hypothetical protein [Deltaproteobacteria bacterium]
MSLPLIPHDFSETMFSNARRSSWVICVVAALDFSTACDGETPSVADAGAAVDDAGAALEADAGNTTADAGTTTADAGTTTADAGTTTADAGTTTADAGNTTADAGTTTADAGTTTADAGTTTADAGTTTADAGVSNVPTWHEDVAPIVAIHCQGCHVEDGIGPFQLMTYEQAFPVASLMAYYTAERIMPPFLADNSGDCNTFQDAKWLTEGEIATIGAWAEGGAPEGTPVAPPTPAAVDSMNNPSVTLTMAELFTPDDGISDEYRCFMVDPGNTEDVFLTAHEVVPGVAKQVHHMILYKPTSEAAEAEAEALSGQDGRPGYTCFGAANVSAVMMAAWAPGMGTQTYPAGTGVRIEAGRKMVMQIHYNTTNGVEPDNTSVRIKTETSVAQEGILTIINKGALNIPPNVPDHIEENNEVIGVMAGLPTETRALWSEFEVTMHGIFPHQHELGTAISMSYTRNGNESCLIDVPRWDFNWQLGYFFDEPVVLNGADDLKITCHFNSMGRDVTTHFGEGTEDEMCLSIVYVTLGGN